MIKSLNRRLAALLIAAISLALLGASGAALIVSERQLSLREQEAFLGKLDALAQEVRMERSLSSAQLAKTEAADQLVLTIYDNGQPIAFRGGWQPVTPREELFARAVGEAAQRGVALDGTADARWTGALSGGQGERYLAAVQSIGSYRSQRAVVLLQDMRRQDAQRAMQRWLFGGITLCAMTVMSVFGWLFTARAVRPIEAAHHRQNAFVAAASHELRTPLQIMQSGLDALKGDPPDPSRFIGGMQRELNRMSRLSEDLMILTGAGALDASRHGPVELTELAAESVQDHLAAAEEKQIALRFIRPGVWVPPVGGDELTLRRAINVLVDNAVCYTQPGGHVQVSVNADPRHLLLRVEDDGPGIAPEHRERVFERFYRADQSRSDRAHNGLGLCIAVEIAGQHGGRLFFESVQPHGCRFTICLPRVSVKPGH